MSIINQTLKDLAERKASSTSAKISLQGFQLDGSSKSSAISPRIVFVFALTTVFFIASFFYHPNFKSKYSRVIPDRGLSTTVLPSLPTVAPHAEAKPRALADVPPLSQALPPSILTGITLQIQKEKTYLGLLLNQSTLYRVVSDPNRETVTITLDHARLIAGVPTINYANSAIKNIQTVNDVNGDLKVILSLNPGVELTRLAMSENKKFPELQIDLLYKNTTLPISTDHQSVSNKKVIIDLANDDLYQQAVALSKEGQRREAIELLGHVVTVSPGFFSARELLAMLLIEEGERREAMAVIDKGLQLKSSYLPYIQMKAHLLVDDNKIISAVNLLRSAAPPIDANPEYYAFIAALYQRLGQFDFAARVYEQLVNLQPTNGLYWAGLGISFDKLGKRSEAIEAFSKAEQLGNLNPALKNYVESH